MAVYNFSLKVKTGKRTKPEVDVYSTAVNEKPMTFPFGKVITTYEMEKWLQKYIQEGVDKYAED